MVVLALVLAGVVGAAAWVYATAWAPSTQRYPLQGVDLGENPPPVEWPTLRAAGADFAYLVATAGTDRRVPSFEANWAALPEAGMRRGAVHVFSLCQPAREQANAFNLVVPVAADALPAALAIEERDECTTRPGRDALIAEVERFLAMAETHSGKPMILRVDRGIERRYRLSEAVPRPVWVIGDGIAPGYAARPWRLWRASDIRRVGGIEGAVNWDVVAP